MIICTSQSLFEPRDLGQALLDRLQVTRGMLDVVLDRRLQIVNRCRDRLRLLGEAQLSELSRIALVSPNHRAASCRCSAAISALETINRRTRVVLVAVSLGRASHSFAFLASYWPFLTD